MNLTIQFLAICTILLKLISSLILSPKILPLSRTKCKLSDTVTVNLEDRSYPIYIGYNNLFSTNELIKHIDSKKVLIVTNDLVGPLYIKLVREKLESNNLQVYEVVLPDGEEYKNMDMLMQIIDVAMDSKLDRKSTMIALGGGVIGDMTGFAAAIYQRGIKFIQIPTTVMAMVDSAVGGKTAVNHPKGKNMIGAFYQPEAVIIDTKTLETLPDREFKSGLAEVIKYGLIKDYDFFIWLEENITEILNRNVNALSTVFRRSCENKADVVNADEKESGIRATLNLGHTFGHAIEAGFGYGVWLHGEAVATGIAMASDLSYSLGWIDQSLLNRIKNLLEKCDLPISLVNPHALYDIGVDNYRNKLKELTREKFIDLMSMDKKVSNGQLYLILLKGSLGNCIITNDFDTNKLYNIIDSYIEKDKII